MEEEIQRARKKALSLLQHMDRTEWELRSKLKKWEFSEEVIDNAIEYVRGFHYIDDLRYAIRFVEIYCTTRSVQRLRQDLLKRHVPEEYIEIALEEIDWDDTKALRKECDRLLRGQSVLTYEEKQKIAAKLYRKGFRVDDIFRQIDLWEQNLEERT